MESSRRDLLNDMAEHGSVLKNNQIHITQVNFTPKTGIEFPETGVLIVITDWFTHHFNANIAFLWLTRWTPFLGVQIILSAFFYKDIVLMSVLVKL